MFVQEDAGAVVVVVVAMGDKWSRELGIINLRTREHHKSHPEHISVTSKQSNEFIEMLSNFYFGGGGGVDFNTREQHPA